MIKKKALLTTLVLLSVMQGSVYAADTGLSIGDNKIVTEYENDTNVEIKGDIGISIGKNSNVTIGSDSAEKITIIGTGISGSGNDQSGGEYRGQYGADIGQGSILTLKGKNIELNSYYDYSARVGYGNEGARLYIGNSATDEVLLKGHISIIADSEVNIQGKKITINNTKNANDNIDKKGNIESGISIDGNIGHSFGNGIVTIGNQDTSEITVVGGYKGIDIGSYGDNAKSDGVNFTADKITIETTESYTSSNTAGYGAIRVQNFEKGKFKFISDDITIKGKEEGIYLLNSDFNINKKDTDTASIGIINVSSENSDGIYVKQGEVKADQDNSFAEISISGKENGINADISSKILLTSQNINTITSAGIAINANGINKIDITSINNTITGEDKAVCMIGVEHDLNDKTGIVAQDIKNNHKYVDINVVDNKQMNVESYIDIYWEKYGGILGMYDYNKSYITGVYNHGQEANSDEEKKNLVMRFWADSSRLDYKNIKLTDNFIEVLKQQLGYNSIEDYYNGLITNGKVDENKLLITAADDGKNLIIGKDIAVEAKKNLLIDITGGSNIISNSENDLNNSVDDKTGYAISAEDGADIDVIATNGLNSISGSKTAIYTNNASVNLQANTNIVNGGEFAIKALGKSNVDLSINDNIGFATNAEDNIGTITLVSQDLDSSKKNDTSTVYVQGDKIGVPEVNVTGNQINILSNNKSVWASGDGGTVNINGAVNINAKYTGTDGTSLLAEDGGQHIAIVAGVAGADSLDTNHGEVNVTLKGTEDSCITGDIVAARDGIVNITRENGYTGKLQIIGDILAGNGRTDSNSLQLGVANVDLGEGGYWEGRADDYKDANLKADSIYFDPHFTDGKVDTPGKVNITMGEGSVWNVTGQSWVTNLTGDKSTIILCGKDTSGNIKGTGGYSIHIGTLEGENTFVVNLNPEDVAGSDMIYIQDGTNAKQTLLVNNESELLNLQEGERIRFATIADAEGSFEYGGAYSGTGTFGETYTVKGRGLKNVELGVQYVDMDKETVAEDTYHDVGTDNQYNGGNKFTESDTKPGSSYVKDTYDKVDEDKNSQNVYLVRGEGSSSNPGDDDDLTDSGETIVNMSHANYKNAVYMDRLNKRLGEARYIDGDEGMWVRMRHDRIGMKDEFRSMNTMYQLGYDKLDNKDDKGERHIGAAIDYMDGSTSYSDIYGEGETKRWGFWMYDTWLGSKGHYADYIVKFGHLHNEFDLKDKDSGEKVTGDYDNNVFSISAEYGRKKDIGNSWYFEPQAQLQLARVTDAEYKTSQDTDVYVDGINSLIGRVGFRLGKDVDERSTVYVKADVLHEFLGDQRITAGDVTGSLDKTYENKGTWYDIGFGFATAVGHDSYAYLDFEKSFGNDNDDTYQINAGLQWNF